MPDFTAMVFIVSEALFDWVGYFAVNPEMKKNIDAGIKKESITA